MITRENANCIHFSTLENCISSNRKYHTSIFTHPFFRVATTLGQVWEYCFLKEWLQQRRDGVGGNPICAVEITLKLFGSWCFAWTALPPDTDPSFLQKIYLGMRPQIIFPCCPWNMSLSVSCITSILAPFFTSFSVTLFDLQGEFLVSAFILIYFYWLLLPLLSLPSPFLVFCSFVIFNPGHFKSSLCFQGTQFSSPLLLTECFFVTVWYNLCSTTSLSTTAHTGAQVGVFVLISHILLQSLSLEGSKSSCRLRCSSYYWTYVAVLFMSSSPPGGCLPALVFSLLLLPYTHSLNMDNNWDCDSVYSCANVPWHFPAIWLRSAVVYLKFHPEYLA